MINRIIGFMGRNSNIETRLYGWLGCTWTSWDY